VVLAAGFAAGVPGMIFGIPAYTVLRVFAREFFNNFKTVQRITSSLASEELKTEKRLKEEINGENISTTITKDNT
jgi:ABC-type phosphate transport system permease subunit